MKRYLIAVSLAIASFAAPVNAADVGVSVSIGQPGFYGRIDIGNYPYPQPRVIYSQPRIIERVYIEREPIYLRVPPGHSKNWGKYCHKYNACGERVYFVQDNWYQREYAPIYQEQNSGHRDEYREDDRSNRNEHRDNRRGKSKNERHGHNH
jgi:hypothetical protein